MGIEMQQPGQSKTVVLFYFSGTGNTWWVSRTLGAILALRGFQVWLRNIETVTDQEVSRLIDGAGIVGIGYPIYGSDLPEPMKAFLAGLPAGKDRPSLVYCTQYLWSGDGARVGAQLMQKQGYRVQWSEHFRMPSNLCVNSRMPTPYTNDPVKLSRYRDRTRTRLERWVNRIEAGQKSLRGSSLLSRFAGSWQRIPYRRGFGQMQNLIGIDQETCILCGKCVRICPVDNLQWEEGRVVSRGQCVLCLRCYDFCPATAMTYRGRRHHPPGSKPYQGPVPGFDPERDLLGPSGNALAEQQSAKGSGESGKEGQTSNRNIVI